MVNNLVLEGKESNLLLERVSDFWFNCYLIESNGKILLGAESPIYIAEHLVNCFGSTDQKIAGTIEGYSVTWVLTLSERHVVLYCAKEQDSFLLFLQDSRENSFGIIGTIEVDNVAAKQWIDALELFKSKI